MFGSSSETILVEVNQCKLAAPCFAKGYGSGLTYTRACTCDQNSARTKQKASGGAQSSYFTRTVYR